MRTRRPAATGSYRLLTRTGRAVLSAAFGLLVLAPASSAGAAESGPALRWKSSGGVDDANLSGTVQLRGDVATKDAVEGWSISVLTRAQEPLFGVICRGDFKRPRDKFAVNCQWDTTRFPDQRPSANAHYLIRLMTHQRDAVEPAGPDRAVTVNNRAAAPTDVTLSYDQENGRATLTWTANPEPDVAHYDVEQKTGTGEWTRITEVRDTRFEVNLPESADHRFRVAAERRNADGAATGPGPWTQASHSQESASAGAKRERRPARPSQPGADRRSGSNRRSAPEGRSDRGHDPRSDGEAKAAPTSGKPSPSPTPKSGSPAGTRRKSAGAEGAEQPNPAAETGKSTSVGAEQPAPADRASLAFSPTSADPISSLRSAPVPRQTFGSGRTSVPAAAKPLVAPRLVPGLAAPPPPDPGFTETLPYAPLPEPEPVAVVPDESAAASPAPGAAGVSRSNTRLRVGGFGLMAAGIALLGLALRPRRRGRRGRPAGPSAPAPPAPVPAAVAVGPAEEPAWLVRLESCVARLEGCLGEQRDSMNHGGNADELT